MFQNPLHCRSVEQTGRRAESIFRMKSIAIGVFLVYNNPGDTPHHCDAKICDINIFSDQHKSVVKDHPQNIKESHLNATKY